MVKKNNKGVYRRIGNARGPRGATGKGLEYNWDGTKLGVRTEGETEYTYSDLKGATGNIQLSQMILSSKANLPTTGDSSVLYLVLKSSTGTQSKYEEYIWVDDDKEYEQVGTGTANVDLTNYVQQTDMLSSNITDSTLNKSQSTINSEFYDLITTFNNIIST